MPVYINCIDIKDKAVIRSIAAEIINVSLNTEIYVKTEIKDNAFLSNFLKKADNILNKTSETNKVNLLSEYSHYEYKLNPFLEENKHDRSAVNKLSEISQYNDTEYNDIVYNITSDVGYLYLASFELNENDIIMFTTMLNNQLSSCYYRELEPYFDIRIPNRKKNSKYNYLEGTSEEKYLPYNIQIVTNEDYIANNTSACVWIIKSATESSLRYRFSNIPLENKSYSYIYVNMPMEFPIIDNDTAIMTYYIRNFYKNTYKHYKIASRADLSYISNNTYYISAEDGIFYSLAKKYCDENNLDILSSKLIPLAIAKNKKIWAKYLSTPYSRLRLITRKNLNDKIIFRRNDPRFDPEAADNEYGLHKCFFTGIPLFEQALCLEITAIKYSRNIYLLKKPLHILATPILHLIVDYRALLCALQISAILLLIPKNPKFTDVIHDFSEKEKKIYTNIYNGCSVSGGTKKKTLVVKIGTLKYDDYTHYKSDHACMVDNIVLYKY